MLPKLSTVTYTKNSYFRVDQTVDHFVPVDTDSGIHKLRVELVFNYKWCTTSEHNFTQSAPIIFLIH